MAGYSGTPLAKKLGIKEGHRVALVSAPDRFVGELEGLPENVIFDARARKPTDVIVLFVRSSAELKSTFQKHAAKLRQTGMLWVSWPKKASGVATDLTENIVRQVGLEAGLVDVKICAVNDVWSGLKFVIRVKDRKAE
jgi:hypothetical protein